MAPLLAESQTENLAQLLLRPAKRQKALRPSLIRVYFIHSDSIET